MSTIPHNFIHPHPGQKVVNDIASLRSSLEGLRTFISGVGRRWIRWILYVLLFLPAVAMLWLAMRKVKKATREIQKAVKILQEAVKVARETYAQGGNVFKALSFGEMTPEEYTRLKRDQNAWLVSELMIKDLKEDELPSIPRWLMYLLSPLANFYLAFRTYNQLATEMLTLLDQSQPDGPYFKKISESELWRKRNKAYEYMI